MVDRKQLRKRFGWLLLTDNLTIVPVVAGATAIGAGIVLGLPLLGIAGALGIVTGIGTCATRFLKESDKVMHAAMDDLREEEEAARHARLNDLEQRLAADDDPRAVQYLRDLREFVQPFRSTGSQALLAGASPTDVFDIASKVEDLFQECERHLERALELRALAGRMSSPSSQAAILDDRAKIVEKVGECVQQLPRVIAQVQSNGEPGASSATSGIDRSRAALDESLDIERRVNAAMASLETTRREPGKFE